MKLNKKFTFEVLTKYLKCDIIKIQKENRKELIKMTVYVVTMTYEPWNETQIDGIYSTWEKANDRRLKLKEILVDEYVVNIEECKVDE